MGRCATTVLAIAQGGRRRRLPKGTAIRTLPCIHQPDSIHERRGMNSQRVLRTLTLGTFVMGIGFNIWQYVFNNFAVQQLNVQPAQMGFIQSVREIPGFLGFGMSFLALVVPELSLASLSLMVMGLGLVLMAHSTNVATLLIYTLVFSVGFHVFSPAQSSVALILSEERNTARLLGRLGSVSAAAAVIAATFVLLGAGPLGLREVLIVAGVISAIGGLVGLVMGRGAQGRGIRQQLVWRKRYWLFYSLTFLMGSRRHIFSTFAIFLLVRDLHITAQVTAVLFLVASLLATYTMRLQGHLVSERGERPMLSFYFSAIAVVCLGYAYVPRLEVQLNLPHLLVLGILFVLFISDSLLSGFDLGVNSYFRKLAPPSEVTANMSMSQTINHISALFVPWLGGIIWERFGSASTFWFGVVVSLGCLTLTQFMRPGEASAPLATAGR
jgi:predicted MFS family arabinose efflux permease